MPLYEPSNSEIITLAVDDTAKLRWERILLLVCHVTSLPAYHRQVRKPTDFGFVLDDMGNLPGMEVDATRIRGTDATVEIRYAFGKKQERNRPVKHSSATSAHCESAIEIS